MLNPNSVLVDFKFAKTEFDLQFRTFKFGFSKRALSQRGLNSKLEKGVLMFKLIALLFFVNFCLLFYIFSKLTILKRRAQESN